MSRYRTARLEDLDRIPVQNGLEWRPVRRRLDIRSFGVNAYTAEKVGDWVVEEHKEGSGHEELYLVLRGRARFTLDGKELDAPAGTIVFLPDADVLRVAIAEEEGTTVLALGGWPDRAFEPSGWEWLFEALGRADGGDIEGGLAIMQDWLADHPDDGAALYNLACIECRAGRTDEALSHVRRAFELRPELAERAREDPDLDPIKEEL
jgi:tetratricopeptide (TPR) repeat protein